MLYPDGSVVDLYDFTMSRWRGKYTVVRTNAQGLHRIKNNKTGSQQWVSEDKLRPSTCTQFRLHILYVND